jgi:hypothetical protein
VFSFLSKEVRAGLDMARKRALTHKNRLRVVAGDEQYPVLRYFDGGFVMDAEIAPTLRGLVDLFDGAKHLSQCLIVASTEEFGERTYEFKRETAHSDHAALDYVRAANAPVALLTKV